MGVDKKIGFEEIKNFSELRFYLDDKFSNLQNSFNGVVKYMCHYTSIEVVKSIIKSKSWYLGSPKNMNDGLELSHASEDVWDNIFFSSFMHEPKESIAMWSMYAQPWSDGVMIRIPIKLIKDWIKSSPQVSSANSNNKKANKDDISNDVKIIFQAVAYSNSDSKLKGENEYIECGGKNNTGLFNITESNQMVGYVKDVAWNYEREYRLRVDNISNNKYDAVAIKIPDELINSIEIVTGPRFKKYSILDEILGEIGKDKLTKSIFSGKLNKTYCDRCEVIKDYNELKSKYNQFIEESITQKPAV